MTSRPPPDAPAVAKPPTTTMETTKEVHIPEWDEAGAPRTDGEGKAGGLGSSRRFGAAMSAKLDAILPPHRRYLGRSRRTFLIIIAVATTCLLALIIGLAAGLSSRHGSNEALPLPSNKAVFSGDLTYYGPGLGACGWTNSASQNIVAVSHILFDAAGSSSSDGGNSNDNPLCGRKLRATRYDTAAGQQRSVDLTVVDRCVGCKVDDLDTSETVFSNMADVAQGRVNVQWAWLS